MRTPKHRSQIRRAGGPATTPRASKAAEKASSDTPRRGIQSVTIGFRVLAALAAEPGPAPLNAIAARASLSASQAHRYLASLVASGMAAQNPASGRYELGPQAIQVGLAALARTDIFAEADPAIAAFTRDTGRTALVAARGPAGPTIVRWHVGRIPVITSLAVGSVLPLLRSATGHAFLSFMSDEEVAGAVEQEDASGQSGAAVNAAAIRKQVRDSMSASVDELLIPGLRATAVPILDIQGRAALVVTMIATGAFARKQDAAIIDELQLVCRALTERFGGRWQ
jgi:DNA-binding IclR family transcriptional regulator